MQRPTNPAMYEINTRVWLRELGRTLGRNAVLDDIGDAVLDRWAEMGMDWIWLMGIWQTGAASQQVSRTQPEWQEEFRRLLPDLQAVDIVGSPYAIRGYQVHADFGGDEALARLRTRLAARGMRLMLDLVPNHTALDHPWVWHQPEFYVQGTPDDLASDAGSYYVVETCRGPRALAHGRDPYFPSWPDTLQLNYRHPDLRAAMCRELLKIAGQCDGVRCDMAMLVLPDVFLRTWGPRSQPADGVAPVDASFWREAIGQTRAQHSEFVFMAEAYWDLEWTLQQEGFSYTYDKRLYDRLRSGNAASVRGHLGADADYQRRSVRFLENHDEPRAAATFPPGMHAAATLVAFLVPGLRLFHEGQFEGRKLHVPVHLSRRPDEEVDQPVQSLYQQVLACLGREEVRYGHWQLLDCRAAWHDNPSWQNFITSLWQGNDNRRLLVAVNYSGDWGQCYVPLPLPELKDRAVRLQDLINPVTYDRCGNELLAHGLYLDVPAWGHNAFELTIS